MSEIYEAIALASGQRVALKILLPHLVDFPGAVARFCQEFRLLASIAHESIVRAFDFDHDSHGRPFFTMERLHGTDLEFVLRRDGRLEMDEVIEIGLQVCEALEVLHARGILHRDLKPSNIFLSERTRWPAIKLIDLGIAKSKLRSPEFENSPWDQDGEVTSPGVVVGSPGYLAPESQLNGPTVAQEIYAVGVTLFKLAVGQLPVGPREPESIEEALLGAGGTRIQARTLAKAMASDPSERHASIAHLETALRRSRTTCAASVTDAAVSAMGAALGTKSRSTMWVLAVLLLLSGLSVWMLVDRQVLQPPSLGRAAVASLAMANGPMTTVELPTGSAPAEIISPDELLGGEKDSTSVLTDPSELARPRPSKRRRRRPHIPSVLRPAQSALAGCLEGLAAGTEVLLFVYFSASGKTVDAWIPGAPPTLDRCVDAAVHGLSMRSRRGESTTVRARIAAA